MSNQAENETQASMTPEEVRQHLLSEIEASQQELAELSEEQLEQVAGGGWRGNLGVGVGVVGLLSLTAWAFRGQKQQ